MLNDIGVVAHCNLDGIRVDLVGMVLHIGEAHLVEAVAACADAIVHGEDDQLFVSWDILQSSVQDVGDDLRTPAIAQATEALGRADGAGGGTATDPAGRLYQRRQLADHVSAVLQVDEVRNAADFNGVIPHLIGLAAFGAVHGTEIQARFRADTTSLPAERHRFVKRRVDAILLAVVLGLILGLVLDGPDSQCAQ